MENFILWNLSHNKTNQELSFFATSIQIQKINQGTEEMLNQMLEDLALSNISYQKWTVKHFVTNYLMDFPPSDNWQDIWLDTWEIKLVIENEIESQFKPTQLIRTYARDKTWTGESLPFPVECMIIANFFEKNNLLKANQVLESINNNLPHNILIVEDQDNLIISWGFYDEDFWATGAILAQEISKIINQLGGTTTWEETTNKLYEI
jgi:hypothetical protein